MNSNHTDITIVLDRSGSMMSVASDTIGGFNKFLADQQATPGTATFTLHQFADRFETPIPASDINHVKPLDGTTYVPRGNTALLDAIGEAVTLTGNRLKVQPEPERAGKVVCVIMTDGYENSSRKYTRAQVFDMIKHQREVYKWEFVFLGANQDAMQESAKIGVSHMNTMSYASNSAGVSASADAVSFNMSAFRTGTKKDMSFEAGDYLKQATAGAANNPPPAKP